MGGGRADYALLSDDGNPKAFFEAKRLGEPLEAIKYQEQVFTYALIQQVRYAGLTDGNLWVLDNVAEFSGGERRKLEVSIALEPAFQCALKLLLIWRPNLGSGQPVVANHPITVLPLEDPQVGNGSDLQTSEPPKGDGWMRLSDLTSISKGMAPLAIWFPTGEERPCAYWWHVLSEVAEWLVRTERLTDAKCPVKVSGVGGKKRITSSILRQSTLMVNPSGIRTSYRTPFTWKSQARVRESGRRRYCSIAPRMPVRSGLSSNDDMTPTRAIIRP